jgi:hypothetical protein
VDQDIDQNMFQLLNRANVNNNVELLCIVFKFKSSSELNNYSIIAINGKIGANITTMLPLLLRTNLAEGGINHT